MPSDRSGKKSGQEKKKQPPLSRELLGGEEPPGEEEEEKAPGGEAGSGEARSSGFPSAGRSPEQKENFRGKPGQKGARSSERKGSQPSESGGKESAKETAENILSGLGEPKGKGRGGNGAAAGKESGEKVPSERKGEDEVDWGFLDPSGSRGEPAAAAASPSGSSASEAGSAPRKAPRDGRLPSPEKRERESTEAVAEDAASILSTLDERRKQEQEEAKKIAGEVTGADLLPPFGRLIISEIPEVLRGRKRTEFIAGRVEGLQGDQQEILTDRFERFLRKMLNLGASDIDFGGPGTAGNVWYRVDGKKRPASQTGAYDPDVTDILVLSLLTDEQREELIGTGAVDFGYRIPPGHEDGSPSQSENQKPTGRAGGPRFRGACYLDNGRVALNMRAIRDEIRPLEKLGFHDKVKRGFLFSNSRDGLTLVTGVTGSGKSTTLDAIIDANNRHAPAHIIVLGEPIEYVHEPQNCIIRHRQVGRDCESFRAGIVEALRQDPDIVVIGEMRDSDTMLAALEISDSGHKVFSTLHCSSAAESIDRIVAEYPPHEQVRIRNRLADVLNCVISQKLLPQIGGGRILAKEVLRVDGKARAAIKSDNLDELYQMMYQSGETGQCTLEQDLYRLVEKNKITESTAREYANNKKRLLNLMRRGR